MFVKAVGGFSAKGVQKFVCQVLRAVYKRTCFRVQSDEPKIDQLYEIAEEEHSLSQLKTLIEEIKLIHAFKDLSDLKRLRSFL